MKKLLLAAVAAGLVSGCATTENVVTDVFGNNTDRHSAYLAAQLAAIQSEKPTFELEAHEGQEIRLTGVKALRVWGGSGAVRTIQPYESPGYKLAHAALGLAPALVGWGMVREVVRALPEVVTPYERSVVDPFERTAIEPFIIEPTVIEPFVAPAAP